MLYSTSYPSLLGEITLVSDGENIVGLRLAEDRHFDVPVENCVEANFDLPAFAMAKKWLDAYFSGWKPPISELPIAPAGNEFRQTVWGLLCEIPYGQCTTYGEIAKKTAARLNKKCMASQAVGGAVGHNPISIIIPCHRVIGANGNLTGYGGGISRKIKLLELEGVDMSNFFIPRKGTAL
ncbi:MAG: methylated-DNA--[protein]-cysteine S-methyltransferase [Syntrophobacteraceae bacterium]